MHEETSKITGVDEENYKITGVEDQPPNDDELIKTSMEQARIYVDQVQQEQNPTMDTNVSNNNINK